MYVNGHPKTAVPATNEISSQNIKQQPAYAQTEEQSVSSLDGTKKLILKQTQNEKGVTYQVFIQNGSEPQTLLFSKSATENESFTLPANAWAPEEKYVFIDGKNKGTTQTLVLKTDGTPFADGNQAADVASLFASKEADYHFDTATGWASPTLLIVESTKQDGSLGPSFWFEAPTQGFIQLSRHQ